ncbi:hypothetical protein ACQCSX_06055 [Pseudarthrobacter sp. P1]|uniref:hypothetical protein n=1 Tax=Pseudarthrobacter sp. P1 TaxID=3418418 RepID=UPI003CECB319
MGMKSRMDNGGGPWLDLGPRDRRWLAVLAAVPVLAALGVAGWALAISSRLPDPLATHWGHDGVDGYSPLWLFVLITVVLAGGSGTMIVSLAVASAGQSRTMARAGAAGGMGFGLAVTGVCAAAIAGQQDLSSGSAAVIDAPTLLGWLSAAALATVLVAVGFRPDTPTRTVQSIEAGPAELARAKSLAAAGTELVVQLQGGGGMRLLAVLVGLAVGLSLAAVELWLAVAAIPVAGLVLVFSRGTVRIGPEGMTVLASGFWRVITVKTADVRGAESLMVRPLDYGGWGYRTTGGAVAFLTAAGPAVSVLLPFAQRVVVSAPSPADAATMAALLEFYAGAAHASAGTRHGGGA